MDLFYNNDFDKNIKQLRKDVKRYALDKEFVVKGKRIPLMVTDPKWIGDNIFVILPPLDERSFNNLDFRFIKELGISRCVITYCDLLPRHSSKEDIREFSFFTHRMIEMMSPKKIVTVGAAAQYTFSKSIVDIYYEHGNIINFFANIPVYTTFNLDMLFANNNIRELSVGDWNKILMKG